MFGWIAPVRYARRVSWTYIVLAIARQSHQESKLGARFGRLAGPPIAVFAGGAW
jgi:hypothetical protein